MGGIRRDCLREQGDPGARQLPRVSTSLVRSLTRSGSPLSFSLALSLSVAPLRSTPHRAAPRLSSPRLASSRLVSIRTAICTYMHVPTCPARFAILLIYFGARFLSLFLSLLALAVAVLPSADDRSKCARLSRSRESRAPCRAAPTEEARDGLCLGISYDLLQNAEPKATCTDLCDLWNWLIFNFHI